MMRLDCPWVLLVLPLPWLVRHFCSAYAQGAIRLPFAERMLKQYADKPSFSFSKSVWWALWMWCGLIIAAARPMWQGEPIQLPLYGRDMMVVLDLSGSMQIEDFSQYGHTVNRLAVAKQVLSEFIARRQGDRIGLILFGDQPYLQSPMTFDLKTVNVFLGEAAIGLAGEKTAIGDAIGLGVKHLIKVPKSNRVLILLTDGANTAGGLSPLEAAEIAKAQQVKIYCIGIGADAVWVQDFFGRHKMNPSADLDEDTLREIATLTDGKYFRATDTRTLEAISEEINLLEPVAQEGHTYRPKRNLFMWPLLFSLICGAGIWHSLNRSIS